MSCLTIKIGSNDNIQRTVASPYSKLLHWEFWRAEVLHALGANASRLRRCNIAGNLDT